MVHPTLRSRGRSIAAALTCSAAVVGLLVGVGHGPAAAVTPPVAVDDTYTAGTSSGLIQGAAGGVLTNDTDDAGPLTASGASDPPHGTVNVNADGSFNYNADPNFVGTDTFTYTVSDGVDGTDTGLVTITVFRDPAVLLKDINPGAASSTPIRATDLGNGTAVFITWDALNRGLYKTDGTAAGTVLVKAIDTGSTGDSPLTPGPIAIGGGKVVFYANDGVNGREPWVSDGTTAGTFMLADINAGSANSNPNNFTAIGGGVALFNANDGITGAQHGVELWRTDGTVAGTSLVLDINPGTASGSPNCGSLTVVGYAVLGSNAYFCAATAAAGNELWTSDGTPAGTVMVKDIRSGTTSSSPSNLSVFNGTLFFGANDGTNGTDLWSSDGTNANTNLFLNINPGSANSSPGKITTFGSIGLFVATTAANGGELWVTDGTPGGTSLVLDIRPGNGSSNLASLTPYGSTVVFIASDGVNGLEPWRTDGTAAGTEMIKDIRPGASASSQPSSLTVFGGVVYMWAFTDTYGSELWKTDGTTAGTVLAQDINPGPANAANNDIRPALGTFLFGATTATSGAELWRFAPPNNAPVANNDAYATNEDTPLTVNAPGVVGNDSDANFNVLHDAVKVADPTNGSVTFNGDGSFTYTPNANYSGPDSFTYQSYDGMDYSNVATVNLTVDPVNDAPAAVDDAYSTGEDAPLTVTAPGVLGNDTDGDGGTLTAGSASDPAHGSVTLSADGSFTYTPDTGFAGDDTFTYVADDGQGGTDTAVVTVSVEPLAPTPPSDFNGNARNEVAVFRPSTGTWYSQDTIGAGTALVYGTAGDVAVNADYDGDDSADVAVYRPNGGGPGTSAWFIRRSAGGETALAYGTTGDIPVPADYDGDGSADIAVFRPSTGVWFVLGSTAGESARAYGTNGDVPVPADYDGDGSADIAVYRPSTGQWFVSRSTGGESFLVYGTFGDIPVPADYDGDDSADIAVFRSSSATWLIHTSLSGEDAIGDYGTIGDIPSPADYDADGRADVAVYRPSTNGWFVRGSTGSDIATTFGTAGDVPVVLAPAMRLRYFS